MTSHRPSQIQYQRTPSAVKPVKEQLRPFTLNGTASGGGNLVLDIDAPNAFLDTSRSYFEFTVTPTLTGPVIGTKVCFPDGGSHAFFKNYRVTAGNGVAEVDNIKEYHKLYNLLTDFAPDAFLRGQFSGSSSGPIGPQATDDAPKTRISDFKFLGCPGITSTTGYTTSHQPLGLLSPSQSKWLPLFLTGSLKISIDLEEGKNAFVIDFAARTLSTTIQAAAADITGVSYVISNFKYMAHLVYLDNAEMAKYIQASQANGPLEITYDTFKYNSDGVQASGTKNINCKINAKSLKSLLILPTDAVMKTIDTAINTNGAFRSPYLSCRTHQGLTDIQLTIGDRSYPEQAMTCTIANNVRTYNELMKALGRLGSTEDPTGIPRNKYVVPSPSDDFTEDADAGAYNAGAIAAYGIVESKFAIGFDLESFPTETSKDPNTSGINTEGITLMQTTATVTLNGTANLEFAVYGICDAKLLMPGSPADVKVLV